MPSVPTLSTPGTGGGAGPGFMRTGGLSLLPTSLLGAALGSFDSCTSPGQHSGADPDGVGVPTLRA